MKTLTEIQRDLKDFIPQGIDLALQAIKSAIAEGTDTYNDLLLLEGRYEDVRRQLIQGVLDDEKAQLEFNKIRKDLLTLIDNLQENHLAQAGGAGEDGRPDVYNGEVLYRIPKKMQMEEEVKCIIRLAFDRKILTEDLEVEEEDVLKDIRISDVMGVELLDPAGKAFEIRTIHDTVQFVEKDLYTEWVYWVKPVLAGKHPLVLKISIIEMRNGIERKRNVVLEETVEIIATQPEDTGEEAFVHSGVTLNMADAAPHPEHPAAPRSLDQTQPAPPPPAPKRPNEFRKIASALAGLALLLTAAWALWTNVVVNPIDVGGLSDAEKRWNEIEKNPSRSNYEEFVKIYPEDELASLAQRKLDSLEQDVWEEALASRDVQKVKKYLNEYPSGMHATDAVFVIEEWEIAAIEEENEGNLGTKPDEGVNAGQPGKKTTNNRPPGIDNAPRPAKPEREEIKKTNKEQPDPEDENTPIPMLKASRLPVYPGCESSDRTKERACTNRSIGKYIKENLKYPEEARRKRIEGTVEVEFIVEKSGKVTGVQYNNDIGGGCAQEAVRLVQQLPDFIPGHNRIGKPARIIYKLPIRFKMR